MYKKITRTFVFGVVALAVALGAAMFWSATAMASEPFLAEVRMFGFNFAPRGWALCDGQILPINQNQSLFSLLGTTYGGDGRTTFALPDLRGRFPMHKGNSGSTDHTLGQKDGSETNLLTAAQLPAHTHTVTTHAYSRAGNYEKPLRPNPSINVVWAKASRLRRYSTSAPDVLMNAGTITIIAGSSTGVDNMPPFIVVNYAIALQGLFPSRN